MLWLCYYYIWPSAQCDGYIWAASWENRLFTYAKTKAQLSFAVTAKLISAFVFATWIVQSLYFLNPKFQASSHLLQLYSLVCVGPGRKPQRPVFSERGSFYLFTFLNCQQHLGIFSEIWVLPMNLQLAVSRASFIFLRVFRNAVKS